MSDKVPAIESIPCFWYTIDVYESDREFHTYCQACFDQIPAFMVKWSQRMAEPVYISFAAAVCEGCGRVSGIKATE